jgi:hypothetical protein
MAIRAGTHPAGESAAASRDIPVPTPVTRRNDSGSPGGAPPEMVVTVVPRAGSSALIMWVPEMATPMWVSQQHRSPAAGGELTRVDPVTQVLYWAATGPCDDVL